MKDKLYVWMTALIVVIIAMLLHVDELFWPGWLNNSRTAITVTLAAILLISRLASPLLVEVDEHPRPLSGPGKDPGNPWDP